MFWGRVLRDSGMLLAPFGDAGSLRMGDFSTVEHIAEVERLMSWGANQSAGKLLMVVYILILFVTVVLLRKTCSVWDPVGLHPFT